MDFILRSLAGSAIRIEQMAEERKRWEERFEARDAKIQNEILDLLRSQREAARSQMKYEKRMRTIEASDRRTDRRVRGIKDLMRLFGKRADLHSKRIDRLERNDR